MSPHWLSFLVLISLLLTDALRVGKLRRHRREVINNDNNGVGDLVGDLPAIGQERLGDAVNEIYARGQAHVLDKVGDMLEDSLPIKDSGGIFKAMSSQLERGSESWLESVRQSVITMTSKWLNGVVEGAADHAKTVSGMPKEVSVESLKNAVRDVVGDISDGDALESKILDASRIGFKGAMSKMSTGSGSGAGGVGTLKSLMEDGLEIMKDHEKDALLLIAAGAVVHHLSVHGGEYLAVARSLMLERVSHNPGGTDRGDDDSGAAEVEVSGDRASTAINNSLTKLVQWTSLTAKEKLSKMMKKVTSAPKRLLGKLLKKARPYFSSMTSAAVYSVCSSVGGNLLSSSVTTAVCTAAKYAAKRLALPLDVARKDTEDLKAELAAAVGKVTLTISTYHSLYWEGKEAPSPSPATQKVAAELMVALEDANAALASYDIEGGNDEKPTTDLAKLASVILTCNDNLEFHLYNFEFVRGQLSTSKAISSAQQSFDDIKDTSDVIRGAVQNLIVRLDQQQQRIDNAAAKNTLIMGSLDSLMESVTRREEECKQRLFKSFDNEHASLVRDAFGNAYCSQHCQSLDEMSVGEEGPLLPMIFNNYQTLSSGTALASDDSWPPLPEGGVCALPNQQRDVALIIEDLIKRFPSSLRLVDRSGDTPLHAAIRGPRVLRPWIPRLVGEYLTAVTSENAEGDLPLHLALRFGEWEDVKVILDAYEEIGGMFEEDCAKLNNLNQSPALLASQRLHGHHEKEFFAKLPSEFEVVATPEAVPILSVETLHSEADDQPNSFLVHALVDAAKVHTPSYTHARIMAVSLPVNVSAVTNGTDLTFEVVTSNPASADTTVVKYDETLPIIGHQTDPVVITFPRDVVDHELYFFHVQLARPKGPSFSKSGNRANEPPSFEAMYPPIGRGNPIPSKAVELVREGSSLSVVGAFSGFDDLDTLNRAFDHFTDIISKSCEVDQGQCTSNAVMQLTQPGVIPSIFREYLRLRGERSDVLEELKSKTSGALLPSPADVPFQRLVAWMEVAVGADVLVTKASIASKSQSYILACLLLVARNFNSDDNLITAAELNSLVSVIAAIERSQTPSKLVRLQTMLGHYEILQTMHGLYSHADHDCRLGYRRASTGAESSCAELLHSAPILVEQLGELTPMLDNHRRTTVEQPTANGSYIPYTFPDTTLAIVLPFAIPHYQEANGTSSQWPDPGASPAAFALQVTAKLQTMRKGMDPILESEHDLSSEFDQFFVGFVTSKTMIGRWAVQIDIKRPDWLPGRKIYRHTTLTLNQEQFYKDGDVVGDPFKSKAVRESRKVTGPGVLLTKDLTKLCGSSACGDGIIKRLHALGAVKATESVCAKIDATHYNSNVAVYVIWLRRGTFPGHAGEFDIMGRQVLEKSGGQFQTTKCAKFPIGKNRGRGLYANRLAMPLEAIAVFVDMNSFLFRQYALRDGHSKAWVVDGDDAKPTIGLLDFIQYVQYGRDHLM